MSVFIVSTNETVRLGTGAAQPTDAFVSTGAVATYSNGTPMVANGAVRVEIVP
jgi:hypothetical protein